MPVKDKEKKRAYNRRWRELHPDYQREWNSSHLEQVRAKRRKSMKAWRLRNPSKARDIQLKKCYGVPVGTYDSLFEKQGGCCAICKKRLAKGKNLSLDHDHKTGKNRGLLCSSCNLALGYFKDNLNLIIRAGEYLTVWGADVE